MNEKAGENVVDTNEVFSIKTKRPVNPEAPRGIVNQQLRDFEASKNMSDSLDSEGKLPEADQEKKREVSPEFEKASTEWREARERAHKIEEEYRTKYEAHILKESKGWRSFANVPRKMFGIQPKLSKELQTLQGASLIARRDYREAGVNLKEAKLFEGKTVGQNEKLAKRYERMLAYHLTVAVHKERLAKRMSGEGQAWKESKYLRPTMETLGKHKYTVMAGSLGAGIALTGGVLPVLAGFSAGFATRFGLGKILEKGYVDVARDNLTQGKEAIVGGKFFESEFAEDDREMEKLTFDVSAREARAKTIANVAGIAAGVSAAGYVNGLSGAENITNVSPELSPSSPEIIPEPVSGGYIDSTTLEPLNMPDSSVADNLPEAPSINDLPSEGVVESDPQVDTSTESVEGPLEDETDGIESISPEPSEVISSNESETISSVDSNDASTESAQSSMAGVVNLTPEVPFLPDVAGLNSLEQEVVDGISSRSEALHVPNTYTVQSGDNVWNILEGKGPDSNPVGGKSEVLEGMSQADRETALNKLVEYAEQNPEFAKEAGAVKSGGDIHRIHPGEQINVSMLDDKLRELLNIDTGTTVESPVAEINAPPVEVFDVSELVVPESLDINDMSVRDIISMSGGVETGDPDTLALLNQMGFDEGTYNALNQEIVSNMRNVPAGAGSMNLPLTEWMSTYGATEATSQAVGASTAVMPADSSAILDRTNYLPNSEGNNFYETSAPVAEGAEVLAEAVKGYVTGVEKGTGGFLFAGRPDVSGTFDSLQNLTLGEFKSLAASEDLGIELADRGVSVDGFTRWGETLEEQAKTIPANDSQTLGQYITGVVSKGRIA